LYQSIEAKMGKAATDEFSRFHTIPGLVHGEGKFLIGGAALATAWTDQGTPSLALTAIDKTRRRSAARARCASTPAGQYARARVRSMRRKAMPV
jgi:hypothetical protein